jgi:hypothetical protein
VLALLLLATNNRGDRSCFHDSEILLAVVEDRVRALDALFLQIAESFGERLVAILRRPRKERAPANLFGTRASVKDVVGHSLRLCGGMDQKLAIIAQLLEPAGDISGLIMNDFV